MHVVDLWRPPKQRRGWLGRSVAALAGWPNAECLQCQVWQLRFLVAARAAGYINSRIAHEHLRRKVLEHVAVNWARAHDDRRRWPRWDDFFLNYCTDVERDVDLNTDDLSWELERVWTNHGAILRGELDNICRRPQR